MTMRAVVMQEGQLSVSHVAIPQPGPGEVLVRTLACGICGSDLHCAKHGQHLLQAAFEATGQRLFDYHQPVVMGHEICAEVVEHGAGCSRALAAGARVVSAPFLLRQQPVTLGFGGIDTPGGYAEYMVLTEALLLPVPDGIPNDVATLTEPLAVALHAVNRGAVGSRDVPIVIGCGPIGLAVIAVLRMRGIGPIVAADFSPTRRAMARALGADVVVDPRDTSPFDSWKSMAAATAPSDFGRQTAMFPGYAFRPAVVFECVGSPGVVQQILAGAPPSSKVVVAGVCMETDSYKPTFAIMKEIDLAFCMAFTPDEYAEAFSLLATEQIRLDSLITGHVGIEGVQGAFDRLASPEQDTKIIIVP
ncbi:zinc-binding dehydrogenase [Acidovorax sp. SUPP3334]|uniref:zinc-binding dehydrogenase n=1 Tax=Acidovorax sp. SUPP3334 TaxID=2920881 RepID=UPI0023DE6997|nr:zinc-binding dehydrogenase [Acidovorax sp. SUPP3334]GKT20626.1 2,3-butanediol dehydrogenase [Acidovorax sp. SUPP3334]